MVRSEKKLLHAVFKPAVSVCVCVCVCVRACVRVCACARVWCVWYSIFRGLNTVAVLTNGFFFFLQIKCTLCLKISLSLCLQGNSPLLEW